MGDDVAHDIQNVVVAGYGDIAFRCGFQDRHLGSDNPQEFLHFIFLIGAVFFRIHRNVFLRIAFYDTGAALSAKAESA